MRRSLDVLIAVLFAGALLCVSHCPAPAAPAPLWAADPLLPRAADLVGSWRVRWPDDSVLTFQPDGLWTQTYKWGVCRGAWRVEGDTLCMEEVRRFGSGFTQWRVKIAPNKRGRYPVRGGFKARVECGFYLTAGLTEFKP